jgi:hypothetical protein
MNTSTLAQKTIVERRFHIIDLQQKYFICTHEQKEKDHSVTVHEQLLVMITPPSGSE